MCVCVCAMSLSASLCVCMSMSVSVFVSVSGSVSSSFSSSHWKTTGGTEDPWLCCHVCIRTYIHWYTCIYVYNVYLYISVCASPQCSRPCECIPQCVAACCSVLLCAAVCCSKLQKTLDFVALASPHYRHLFVAVCCSELQCVAWFCSMSQCVAIYCTLLQCVAVQLSSKQPESSFQNVLKIPERNTGQARSSITSDISTHRNFMWD